MSTTVRGEQAGETRPESTTRVDAPHGVLPASEPRAALPPLDLLQAIAGHDTQASAQQLRGQSLELAAILREKQRQLEQRESDLNARTALLENDLRSVRLQRFREDRPAPASGDNSDQAQRSPSDAPPLARGKQPAVDSNARTESRLRDEMPEPAIAPPEIPDTLVQQRRQLREREEKLDRRQRHVERMHDEITLLHRETLELRLATEQLWTELTDQYPADQLVQSLEEIRGKLSHHYRLAHDTLNQRKDELHQLRNELNLQEQRLRQQRREIQLWADRQYDEIESRLTKLVTRERELDLLEGDLQRQSLQWQQQRSAYRQEIEQLSRQLPQRSVGKKGTG